MNFNRNRSTSEGSAEPDTNVLALLLGSLAVAAVTVVAIWTIYFQVGS
ncbi:hypothetical protein JQ580_03755 [Bradyrhizobium japonicum]|jgi:hypothetical protein|nr:hypothetical protein [Bradyrhizobium japonicum]MBR0989826.1 hypothetical protein [Bradyrhizobium japonicum]